MEITQLYPIRIEQWLHLPLKEFMGRISDEEYYTFGISAQDPNDADCCYFNIWIEKTMRNEFTSVNVFYAKTYSAFKVKNLNKIPTSEFFFSLFKRAKSDFAFQFHQRVLKTNLAYHKIAKPQYNQFKKDLERTIETYSVRIYDPDFNVQPDWQLAFRNLPKIPLEKQWIKGLNVTSEQQISFKLQNKQSITKDEEISFEKLSSFYKELDDKLTGIDYKSFNDEDFANFKNYIFYAFNYIALISNKLTIKRTYRLVVNEKVSGKNEPISNIDFLKYPSIEIVKKVNQYNRANTPQTNIFYSSENIDTTLKELRPSKNMLLSVSVWKTKDYNKRIISFPISHSETAIGVNEGVLKTTQAFEELSNHNSSLLMNFYRYYFKLLGREYTKKINYHYEYLITALFSERIFGQHYSENKDFRYDCVIYPSVGNDFLTQNFAILPNVLDNDFELDSVLEFEVDEEYYDKKYVPHHPETITLAKVKNLRRSSSITPDGTIEWQ